MTRGVNRVLTNLSQNGATKRKEHERVDVFSTMWKCKRLPEVSLSLECLRLLHVFCSSSTRGVRSDACSVKFRDIPPP